MDNLNIENAKIIFRNFAGKETRFNNAGTRNFCVIIDEPKIAKQMMKDGWNIKTLEPKDKDDDPLYFMQVSVRFNAYPPKIMMITGKTKTYLNENTVGLLDGADIANVDLVIRPYEWVAQGKNGIKAYLKTMYVTIQEDAFANKYRDDFDDLDINVEDDPF